MAHKQEDLSQLPSIYERVTTATETPEELHHRLKLESIKLYASLAGVGAVFVTLTLILFLHDDPELIKVSSALLNTLAGGLIGYLLKR